MESRYRRTHAFYLGIQLPYLAISLTSSSIDVLVVYYLPWLYFLSHSSCFQKSMVTLVPRASRISLHVDVSSDLSTHILLNQVVSNWPHYQSSRSKLPT